MQETSWSVPDAVTAARAAEEAERRKEAEAARRAAAQKRALMEEQIAAQRSRQPGGRPGGGGGGGGGQGAPHPGGMGGGMMGQFPGGRGGGGMMPFLGGRGGRGGGMHPQYQMMALMAAQRQAAEKQRSKEELAGRFKELLMDKGVSGLDWNVGNTGCGYLRMGVIPPPSCPLPPLPICR